MSSTDFNDTWAPTWVVQETIPGALKHIVENTGRTFKSGREVKEAVFFDKHRREVARREGMLLTSKRGYEYCVCRRKEDPTPNETASHAPSVGEIFDDI
jgi:hypothetical protein